MPEFQDRMGALAPHFQHTTANDKSNLHLIYAKSKLRAVLGKIDRYLVYAKTELPLVYGRRREREKDVTVDDVFSNAVIVSLHDRFDGRTVAMEEPRDDA
ncbi:hypothetical protein KM043_010664 [Ampulex compressa]|nr:hypothetical protein KM043_010664 [Ampulex compressa]